MITPMLHQRVNFHMDKLSSPRMKRNLDIDQALNIAIDKYVNTGTDTLELKQYLRDEFRPLAKRGQAVTVVSNVITLPADYRTWLSLELVIGGVTYRNPDQLSSGSKGPSFDNAFTEPAPTYPAFIEGSTGLTIYCGTASVTSATMDYLANPDIVFYSETTLTSASALTVGTTYYVETGTVTHNSVVYSASVNGLAGDTFVAVSTVFTGSGTVAAIRNCNLGATCHEEIAKIASAILSGTYEDYGRYQVKAMEGRR